MDCGEVFVPFDTMGTVIHIKSRAPTDWEIKHLPQISYTSGDQWSPTDNDIFRECKTQEQMEMCTIKSLTSWMTNHDMRALRLEQAKAQVEEYGKVEHKLGKILHVYNVKLFCNCPVTSMRIATTFQEDVDDE